MNTLSTRLLRIALPMKKLEDVKREGLTLYVLHVGNYRQFVLLDMVKVNEHKNTLGYMFLNGGSYEHGFLGGISILLYQDVSEVISVEAVHGYGPTLYYLALSWLKSSRGSDLAWLRPNLSESVNHLAREVWKKIAEDPKVERRPVAKENIPTWAKKLPYLKTDYRLKRSWSLKNIKVVELDSNWNEINKRTYT